MTQELLDLKTSVLEGRYADVLAIVDELEGPKSSEPIWCSFRAAKIGNGAD